ncbi:MAG: TIGR03862 family flavoprotein [Sulfuritalea sp.]|nr:TIGR03862 family flavoprotein [Sulfuritalea sp.]MDP1984522.1 TIGR03862 family flavoprotein [Sulfuritalea sp.]
MPAAEPQIRTIVVIGGGPAGLMAAEVLSDAGLRVEVFDAMPSVARKFLLAGRGGLNLTHSEPPEQFVARYGARRAELGRWLAEFGPQQLRDWASGLGIETFVGSSGRVFPQEMKAAPLLRAWLHRLRRAGVVFHARHRWLGWDADGALRFATPAGESKVGAGATVLALGGGSWARLGSDGAWLPLLAARGVAVQPLRPANCGFDVAWSEHLRQRYAGTPVKNVSASFVAPDGFDSTQDGEFLITEHGVEGNLIYALAAPLRDCIEATGGAIVRIDLAPGRDPRRLSDDLAHPRGRDSLANHLRRRAGISGVKAALLYEFAAAGDLASPQRLAAIIKSLPLRLEAPRPLDEAISSAGGVDFAALDDKLMLRVLPGCFCAGEMLDWEAPTGGYLLTACFASGRAAGLGVLRWLAGAQSAMANERPPW